MAEEPHFRHPAEFTWALNGRDAPAVVGGRSHEADGDSGEWRPQRRRRGVRASASCSSGRATTKRTFSAEPAVVNL